MSWAVIAWIAVGTMTVAAMVAVILAMLRHLRLLQATLTRFQREIGPLLENIQAESERARVRGDELPERIPPAPRMPRRRRRR